MTVIHKLRFLVFLALDGFTTKNGVLARDLPATKNSFRCNYFHIWGVDLASLTQMGCPCVVMMLASLRGPRISSQKDCDPLTVNLVVSFNH